MKYLSSPKKIAAEMRTLKFKDRNSIISLVLYIVTIISLIYPVMQPKQAHATLTQSFVRIDRHSTGADISGSACIETSGSHGTDTNVSIVFPTDWTIDSTPANWTANDTNLPYDPTDVTPAYTQSTMWAGITNAEAASAVDGNTVTWTATDLTDDIFYCFNFSGGAGSDIGAAGDNKTGILQVQGGSPFLANVEWAVDVVTSNADQITVTASVSAQMTFALSGNTATLGTLASGSTAAASGINQTVTTNARNGWISWVKSGTNGGSNAGALHSTIANADIVSPGSWDGTPQTLSSTGGYVLDVDAGAGCATGCVNDEYEGGDADSGGHLAYNIFHITATDTTPTSGDVVSLVVKARSSATTPAGSDYTDTLTVVAAGSF